MIGVAIAGLLVSAGSAVKQSKDVKEDERNQKKQLALQRKTDLIRARREARIKAAQFTASTSGAGVGGSVIQGVDIGSKTSLQSGFQTAESQYALQSEQFSIAADSASSNAFFNFGQSAAAAGATIYSNMPDTSINSTSVTAANNPGSTGTPMYFLPNA